MDSFWTVRVRRFYYDGDTKLTEVIAYVPFIEMMFSLELNGPGGGSVTFDLDSEFLQYGDVYEELTDNSHVWELMFEGVIVAQFLSTKFEIQYVSAERQRRAVISGPGLLEGYRQVAIYPPIFKPSVAEPTSFPAYPLAIPTDPAADIHLYMFHFSGQATPLPHMHVWKSLLAANRVRANKTQSVVNFVTEDFTNTHDSAGVAWTAAPTDFKAAGTAIASGPNMMDFLINQANTINADFCLVPIQDNRDEDGNFVSLNHTFAELVLKQDYGTDLSDSVAFFDPNVFSKSKTQDVTDIENSVVAAEKSESPKLHYQRWQESIDRWGRREKFLSDSDLTQDLTSSAAQVTHNRLYQYKDPIISWTAEIPAYNSLRLSPTVIANVNIAGVDYSVGDWIGIGSESNRDKTKTATPLRVQVLSGKVDDSGTYKIETTLESRSQLTRRLPPGETRSLTSFAGYYEKWVPGGDANPAGVYVPKVELGDVDYTRNLYPFASFNLYSATTIDDSYISVS